MLPNTDPAKISSLCALYRQECQAAGSTEHAENALSASWVFLDAIVAETEGQARDFGLQYIELMREYRAAISPAFRARFPILPVGTMPAGTLCGSPLTVLEQIKEYAQTGVGGLLLRFRAGPMPSEFAKQSMSSIMSEVYPPLMQA